MTSYWTTLAYKLPTFFIQFIHWLCWVQGRIQNFKLGGALRKIAASRGRRENFLGISCEKSRFYAKKSYFFQLPREARKFWGISCEKSRFYANFFSPILGGARAGCPSPGVVHNTMLLYFYMQSCPHLYVS